MGSCMHTDADTGPTYHFVVAGFMYRSLGADKVKDVLKMVGMELAFRCSRSPPSQEKSRRELIIPVLYAAAYLSSRWEPHSHM